MIFCSTPSKGGTCDGKLQELTDGCWWLIKPQHKSKHDCRGSCVASWGGVTPCFFVIFSHFATCSLESDPRGDEFTVRCRCFSRGDSTHGFTESTWYLPSTVSSVSDPLRVDHPHIIRLHEWYEGFGAQETTGCLHIWRLQLLRFFPSYIGWFVNPIK